MRAARYPTIVLLTIWAIAACDRPTSTPAAPSAPTPPVSTPAPAPTPTRSNGANWTGNAVVVSVVNGGHACGWGTTPNETRNGVQWAITNAGDAIVLDEDMPNWPTDDVPYTGSLVGLQFTAADASGSDYLKYVCQFKGSSLSGRFTPDFSSFEADETLTWGPPGNETVVRRHWTGAPF